MTHGFESIYGLSKKPCSGSEIRSYVPSETPLFFCSIWGSIILWFLFLAVYSYFWPTLGQAANMTGMVSVLILPPYLELIRIPALTYCCTKTVILRD